MRDVQRSAANGMIAFSPNTLAVTMQRCGICSHILLFLNLAIKSIYHINVCMSLAAGVGSLAAAAVLVFF